MRLAAARERGLIVALVCLTVIGIGFVAIESALGNTPSKGTVIVLTVAVAAALALVLALDAVASPGKRDATVNSARRAGRERASP